MKCISLSGGEVMERSVGQPISAKEFYINLATFEMNSFFFFDCVWTRLRRKKKRPCRRHHRYFFFFFFKVFGQGLIQYLHLQSLSNTFTLGTRNKMHDCVISKEQEKVQLH